MSYANGDASYKSYMAASAPPLWHTNPNACQHRSTINIDSSIPDPETSPKGWKLWKPILLIVVGSLLISAAIAIPIVVLTKNKEDSSKTLVVTLQSSNTKQDWINQVVNDFNAANFKISGKDVRVRVFHTTSALDVQLMPTIWSPSDHSWINQALKVNGTSSVSSISTQCRSSAAIPSGGIAMWGKLAAALGWPSKPISMKNMTDLAGNPKGWASIDEVLAEYGQFKLGHGSPETSNTGRLFFLSGMYSAANGTALLPDGSADLTSATVEEAMAVVERHVYHLGRQDLGLLDRALTRGPSYMHAVVTAESTLISYNTDPAHQAAFQRWGDKLVFIYPSDGTFWQPHPICVLDKAPWSDTRPGEAELREAGLLFSQFATSSAEQEKATAFGVRPYNSSASRIYSSLSTITVANGANPEFSRETVPSLQTPSDAVETAAVQLFKQVKRPASVALVIDTSGSMADNGGSGITKLSAAQQAATKFVNNMADKDSLYALRFSSKSSVLGQIGRAGEVRQSVVKAIGATIADGSTALYSTMTEALVYLKKQATADRNSSSTGVPLYNYALVVMTDGVDTDGGKAALDAQLPSGEDAGQVHIWTIAFGNDAGATAPIFNQMASQTNGQAYVANVENIGDAYQRISEEF